MGDSDGRGFGALWSTKVFGGEFHFNDSAQIIDAITNAFKATPSNEYGYFSMRNGMESEQKRHTPLSKGFLMAGKQDVNILIPKGQAKRHPSDAEREILILIAAGFGNLAKRELYRYYF